MLLSISLFTDPFDRRRMKAAIILSTDRAGDRSAGRGREMPNTLNIAIFEWPLFDCWRDSKAIAPKIASLGAASILPSDSLHKESLKTFLTMPLALDGKLELPPSMSRLRFQRVGTDPGTPRLI